jgi:biopolymer transport protein TolR
MPGPVHTNRFVRKRMAEINVVPYIDVMLVLLVIFMVTAPVLSTGQNVQLPEGNAPRLEKTRVPPVIVSIDRHGKYRVNLGRNIRKVLSPDELVKRVTARRKKYPDVPVYIKCDTRTNFGRFANAMNILRDAGIDDVSIIFKPTKE